MGKIPKVIKRAPNEPKNIYTEAINDLTCERSVLKEILSLYITPSTSSAIKEPIIPPFPKPLLKEAARRNVPKIKEKILSQNLFIFLIIL